MKRWLMIALLASVKTTLATTPTQDISSAGPLIHVWIGNDLSFQVEHTLDSPDYELYGGASPDGIFPGDAGTFIFTSATLYAPDFANHGYSAAGFFIGTYTPFTAISQSSVTGSGTGGDPYTVITVNDAFTGFRITQTDTYVVGDSFFSTQIVIANTTGGTATGILYRAFDAFLGGSDTGYGFTETLSGSRNAIGVSVTANNIPPGKIIELIPQTGGNNYIEDEFDVIWGAIGAHTALPDTCQCTTALDNGAGISWNFSIADGGSATFSHTTVFEPIPLPSPTPTATATPAATATATSTPTATATATATINPEISFGDIQ